MGFGAAAGGGGGGGFVSVSSTFVLVAACNQNNQIKLFHFLKIKNVTPQANELLFSLILHI